MSASVPELVPSPAGRLVRRAAITSLGCKVNQAEMDALERLLRGRGIDVVDTGGGADLQVINTCTVTAVADDKSRKAVRRARRASPGGRVLVTGCAVAVGADTFRRIDPDALLLANETRDGLLAEVERLLGPGSSGDPARGAALGQPGTLGLPDGPFDGPLPTLAGVVPVTLPGVPVRISRARAYLKVQDGCSFHCTYCVIPRARGPERSSPPREVLADARQALAAGHRELVLTGINVGTYDGGRHATGPGGGQGAPATSLAGLVRLLLAETRVERLRISSIEPQHVDDELLATMAGSGGRCLPHVHLPLQSGDDGVLRRMGRRYGAAFYARTVERIRAAMPGVAVHADVIAGFPTEDDAAWARTLDLVCSLDLAGLHVFRYSDRPGTPSTRMTGQVPGEVRRARSAELLALAETMRRTRVARAAGSERLVLVEETDGTGGWIGHAEDMLPVRVPGADGQSLGGEITRVAVVGPDPDDPERAIGRLLALVPRPGLAGA